MLGQLRQRGDRSLRRLINDAFARRTGLVGRGFCAVSGAAMDQPDLALVGRSFEA
jgi:hypothetical protein